MVNNYQITITPPPPPPPHLLDWRLEMVRKIYFSVLAPHQCWLTGLVTGGLAGGRVVTGRCQRREILTT